MQGNNNALYIGLVVPGNNFTHRFLFLPLRFLAVEGKGLHDKRLKKYRHPLAMSTANYTSAKDSNAAMFNTCCYLSIAVNTGAQ